MDKLPNYRTDFRSIKKDVSPEEWQARVDLAACYRLIDSYGMTDLTYNHITVRVPGPEEHLLINLYGMLYKEITASSLAKIDLDGNVIWKPDTDYYVNKAGYVIHGCIHRARSNVRAVIHTHTRAGMAVAATHKYPNESVDVAFNPIGQVVGQFTKVEKSSAVIERWVQEYLEATNRLDELNEAASV